MTLCGSLTALMLRLQWNFILKSELLLALQPVKAKETSPDCEC